MDVLFVDVPADFSIPTPTWCLGYRSMISTLRQEGFSAAILHPDPHEMGRARQRLIQDLLKANPEIAGFTTYDLYLNHLFQFIRDARKAGLKAHITLGGVCASSVPAQILSFLPIVDSVICGEGDLSIVDLAKTVIRKEAAVPAGIYLRQGGKIVFGGPRPLIENLDELPFPSIESFASNGEYYLGGRSLFAASRGCYGKCTFCSLQQFYRSCPGRLWRGRDAKRVVQEVSTRVAFTGSKKITFIDENFLGPGIRGRRHALDIANALQQKPLGLPFNFGCRPNDLHRETLEALKKAGLAAVSLGIESMSAEALRLFNKWTTPQINEKAVRLLEELSLSLEITFIFFHPLTTLQEIRKNLQFIDRIRRSKFAYFNKNMPFTEFIPFFQTEYTRRLEEMKLVKRTLHGYTLSYLDPRVEMIARKTRSIPLEQLSRLANELQTENKDLESILQSIREYATYLNLIRLPELLADFCDFFDRGGLPAEKRARAVSAEFDRETRKIHSLFGQVLSLEDR